jgi:hypothetical protein
MTDLTTPVKDFVAAVNSTLEAVSALVSIPVYDYWIPPSGHKLPCISIYEIGGGWQEEIGLGQNSDTGEVGIDLPIMLQIDVWGMTASDVRDLTEAARYGLWLSRGNFGNKRKNLLISVDQWTPPYSPNYAEAQTPYRKTFMVKAWYAMTKVA